MLAAHGTSGASEKKPILQERYRPKEPSCCEAVKILAQSMFTNSRNGVPATRNPAGGSDYRSGIAYYAPEDSDEEQHPSCIIL